MIVSIKSIEKKEGFGISYNKALHLTAIPLRSIAAGELSRYVPLRQPIRAKKGGYISMAENAHARKDVRDHYAQR